jgi:uncharacterized protein
MKDTVDTIARIHRVRRDGVGETSATPRERHVSGAAEATVWNAFSNAAGRFHVGHWSAEPGIRIVHYTEDEFCLLLEGRVRLDGPDGSVEFVAGDAFVIEAGFLGTWETVERVVKIYAVAEPERKVSP